ncbi:sugar O-acetyltransferase [Candidatus Stoquefichus massiliensis]|uniref:sugar O-acetyltransferase n=1 Tax=Candidatus Stoquefichus massiliensis TaxID=1470350 RepID=UPI0004827576|nr:sugar O-acetyltransferase [Candidatus Stoquefichus massiliensis]
MSEKQKMLEGHLYQPYSSELYKDREFCKGLLHEYNLLNPLDKDSRDLILKKLLKCKGELCIEQPFYCSYGYNITIGLNFYSDVGLTILDQGGVSFGDNVILGPHVNIYTASHPYNEVQRIKGLEYTKPVIIYDNVWIGGNVTILPGVKINQGAIIGAGSVVTHDIPPYVIAVGNPCEVIRSITKEDVHKNW